MSMLTPEQIVAAQKSTLETMFSLTGKAFEGVEQVVALNLQLGKNVIGGAANTTSAWLSAKDAQQLLTLQSSLLQPAAEQAAAYSRQLYEIGVATQAEIGRLAETQTAGAQARLLGMIDEASKNAPPGSENAVAVMKSAVAAASNAFDALQKAMKQASDLADAHIKALSTQATAVAPAAGKTKRTA